MEKIKVGDGVATIQSYNEHGSFPVDEGVVVLLVNDVALVEYQVPGFHPWRVILDVGNLEKKSTTYKPLYRQFEPEEEVIFTAQLDHQNFKESGEDCKCRACCPNEEDSITGGRVIRMVSKEVVMLATEHGETTINIMWLQPAA